MVDDKKRRNIGFLRMKKLSTLFALTSVAFLSGCNCGQSDNEGWTDLFNKDLSNAIYPAGVWSVTEDGVFKATKDEIIFSKNDYENFEIELEFKIESKSNSGIVIYCTDTKDWIPNSVEVQIADSSCESFSKPTWTCGSIFGHVPSEFDTKLPFGVWHKMRVRCEGQNIDAWLNGKHVSHMDMSKWTDNKVGPDGTVILPWLTKQKKCDMPTKGKVGLQGKHGGAATDFRNIKIRPIQK